MRSDQDYVRDLAEIRSMMERSTKFLSLSGWAGILAGLYALAAAYLAVRVLGFNPRSVTAPDLAPIMPKVLALAVAVLALATATAAYFSFRHARQQGERAWNATSRRLLGHMAVPLVSGGILALLFVGKGLLGLLAPLTLLFYGLALVNAGPFTYREVRILGLIQILLGLLGAWLVPYGMLLWSLGFGLVHIAYGLYMKVRHEL